MNEAEIREAAACVWGHWRDGRRMEALPAQCRPSTIEDAYAVQAALATVTGDRLLGWKIAATSKAGQAHIAVDGPLAGRLFERRIYRHPASIPLGVNHMRVAEAEFAFVLKEDVPPKSERYRPSDLLAYVGSLHPAVEIPDSRFEDYTRAGAAQLVADNACAHQFVIGEAADDAWRSVDLADHLVEVRVNDEFSVRGRGSDVLGEPLAALAWIANNHADRGEGLYAGQIVTTGVCGKPVPVSPGDRVLADFGFLGRVTVTFDEIEGGRG